MRSLFLLQQCDAEPVKNARSSQIAPERANSPGALVGEKQENGPDQGPPPGRLVAVVHSGVMDAVVRWAFSLAPDVPWTTEVSVPNASVTELHHWPQGRHPTGAPRHTFVARLGDVSHLSPELVTDG